MDLLRILKPDQAGICTLFLEFQHTICVFLLISDSNSVWLVREVFLPCFRSVLASLILAQLPVNELVLGSARKTVRDVK